MTTPHDIHQSRGEDDAGTRTRGFGQRITLDRKSLLSAIGHSLLGFAVVGLVSMTIASAQSGGSYDLTWNTIDGGGGASAGGTISLQGTIGQPDTGELAGGTITLSGGFWKGGLGGPTSGVPDVGGPADPIVPLSFRLYPNAPNPFASSTVLTFDLPEAEEVQVAVYDASGARVRKLVDDRIEAGNHLRIWDGTDDHGRRLPSGVYFAKMQTPTREARQKLWLLR